MAFRDAIAKSKPVILEPIMKVKITVPNAYMGDVTGDLNHKRGRILGMGTEEGMQVVNADVPLIEMAKYATELRSMTHGRGVFKMDFERYEQVPSNIANETIAKHQAVSFIDVRSGLGNDDYFGDIENIRKLFFVEYDS